MIFDFLIITDFKNLLGGTPRKPAFSPQTGDSLALRRNSREEGEASHYSYTIVRRQESVEDKCTGDGAGLFLMGEVFSSAKFAARKREPERRLGASEVLSLWNAEPAGFQNYLKGNFQFVLVNERKAECTLCNSRFGISPFYYAARGSRFLCSTSLAELIRFLPATAGLDGAAITEHALFNYPLLGRSFFRDVRSLQPAEVVCFRAGEVTSRRYWNLTETFQAKAIPEAEALDQGSSLFRQAVHLRASEPGLLSLSLTGGFDGRASLAAIEKPSADILCYAFGIPGSLNVTIPGEICRKTGYRFLPILLNADYEKVFDRYADEALFLSDGLSTIERANYPYAFQMLAQYSPIVLTGIFGSELLRTFQNVGLMVSPTFVAVNSVNRDQWTNVLKNAASSSRYFEQAFMSLHLPEVLADLETIANECADLPSANDRFYHFLFTQALRKYFGAEVHMERVYASNRFPYLDDDFVEFMFRAPFSGVHSTPLSPTAKQKFQSQYFYAYVIRRYRPEMLQFTTDHGFPPADLLRPLPFLWIAPKFVFHRQLRKLVNYREFKTEEWTGAYYRHRKNLLAEARSIFSSRLCSDLETGQWLTNRADFAKGASLDLWLSQVQRET